MKEKMVKRYEVEFHPGEETKNAIRCYELPGEFPPIVGTLDLQKWAARNAKRIRVTIEVIE